MVVVGQAHQSQGRRGMDQAWTSPVHGLYPAVHGTEGVLE
jgi:hypothetical protein